MLNPAVDQKIGFPRDLSAKLSREDSQMLIPSLPPISVT